MQSMAHPNPPKMSASQFAKIISPVSQNVADVHHFEGRTRTQSLMKSNTGSANITWESADVNRGPGSLAGYQLSNRGTLVDTGF